MNKTLSLMVMFSLLWVALAAQFTDLLPFQMHEYASHAWGDYNNDGYADLAISANRNGENYTAIFRNNGDGSFGDIGLMLPYLSYGVNSWADYDGDGDQDLLLCGALGNVGQALLYRNEGAGIFTEVQTGIAGVYFCAVEWADFDNDTDPDLLIQGINDAGMLTRIYVNQGAGTFSDLNANLQGMWRGKVHWGDLEGDGDLDILCMGEGTSTNTLYTKIYLNGAGGVFTELPNSLPNVTNGDICWADYDADNDLDILISGDTGTTGAQLPFSGLFENNANAFTEVNIAIPELMKTASLWYDLDNDGDQDFILSGQNGDEYILVCYSNNGQGAFTAVPVSIPPVIKGKITACDYDNDGDPDLCVAGTDILGRRHVTIAKNHLNFTFQEDIPILQNTSADASAWGDLDGDGDLDLVISAYAGTYFYRNDGQSRFRQALVSPLYVDSGSLALDDYDRDGDLDLLLSGYASVSPNIPGSFVLRNSGNWSFTDIHAGLDGLSSTDASWADYDNDGDADILLCGMDQTGRHTLLYRNLGYSIFSEVTHNIAPFRSGDAAWADFTGDGFLDLAIGGETTGNAFQTKIYRNNQNGGFIGALHPSSPMDINTLGWGDYDGDGDLDLGTMGNTWGQICSPIFRYDGNYLFSLQTAGLSMLEDANFAWMDIDNDGDLDLFASGSDSLYNSVLKINLNDGEGNFSLQNHFLRGVKLGKLDPGDFDNDGDLDLLMGGRYGNELFTSILRNDTPNANTPPTAPTSLAYQVENGRLVLSWAPGSDTETPANMLSYAIRMGTSSEAVNIVTPLATADGSRLLHRRGPIGTNCSWSIALADLPHAENYYWSVQTIDSSFKGSNFSEQQVITGLGASDPNIPSIPSLALDWPHPNPFSRELKISYTLDKNAHHRLEVFNIKGQRVRTLCDASSSAGMHTLTWDGTDDQGKELATGIYFILLSRGNDTQSKKVLHVHN